MIIDENARYMESHEWARPGDGVYFIGVTDYAQSTLSDVVYVELPEIGDRIEKDEQFGVIESVKAAADIFSPLSGEVVAINERLEDEPELVNASPFEDGWLIQIKPTQLEDEWDTLLSPLEYKEVVEAEEASH
ncbi:MAG: glycine cleavage system protein GcvH [Anaerolineae bacterium]|nr:glycine cleavage system protein GcvH [Anaerolineae bacterium]